MHCESYEEALADLRKWELKEFLRQSLGKGILTKQEYADKLAKVQQSSLFPTKDFFTRLKHEIGMKPPPQQPMLSECTDIVPVNER